MSYRINKEKFKNLDHLKNQRLDWMDPLRLHAGNCIAGIVESFECCGKAYIFGFESFANPNPEEFFKQAVEIVNACGYSAVGMLHVKDNFFLKAAERAGFKPVVQFHNKRSGNDLVEMILIL